jgi:hypothetical protein
VRGALAFLLILASAALGSASRQQMPPRPRIVFGYVVVPLGAVVVVVIHVVKISRR